MQAVWGEFMGDRLLKRCRGRAAGLAMLLLLQPTTGVFVAAKLGRPGEAQTTATLLLLLAAIIFLAN